MHAYVNEHPGIRSVPWRDLVAVSRTEVVAELALSLPWLAAALYLGSRGWYAAGLACSFMFFLAALRQVHNGFHYVLGLTRRWTDWVIGALSVLMLGSNHAVQYHHLRHHGYCLEDEDMEAVCARQPGWRVVLLGCVYPARMLLAALRGATPAARRWIVGELCANALWIVLVFGVLDVPALRYHVVAMAIGQWLAPFFCVWSVHHGCDRAGVFARTERRGWLNVATYNMLLHLEHHLFPAVPTRHLGELSRRLDAAIGSATHAPVVPPLRAMLAR